MGECEREIVSIIDQWDGTAYGESLKNMYENGTDFESICEYAGLDYQSFDD